MCLVPQVHIQTIGILVAEKTELQSQVSQSQRIADQRIGEFYSLIYSNRSGMVDFGPKWVRLVKYGDF